jgi:hypothetical protein
MSFVKEWNDEVEMAIKLKNDGLTLASQVKNFKEKVFELSTLVAKQGSLFVYP